MLGNQGLAMERHVSKIMRQLNVLLVLAPEDVPEASRFLLKINFSELSTSNLETQKYWTLAVDAALKAKALESVQEAQAKQVRQKLNTKIPSRTKLGIGATIEQQICKDGMHRAMVQTDALQANDCSQLSLKGLFSGDLTQPPLWAA
jgi:hypothetical protein